MIRSGNDRRGAEVRTLSSDKGMGWGLEAARASALLPAQCLAAQGLKQ